MITTNRDLRQKLVGCSIFRAIADGKRVFVTLPFHFRFHSQNSLSLSLAPSFQNENKNKREEGNKTCVSQTRIETQTETESSREERTIFGPHSYSFPQTLTLASVLILFPTKDKLKRA